MDIDNRLTALTRIGFATRGLLYIVIALLILRTGRAEDPSGALQLLAQGGGRVLLAVMAAGLIAYGLWRLSDAIFNIEGHDADNKGLAQRAGAGGSGLVHLLLAWQAVRLIQGTGSGTGGSGAEQGAQTALSLPGGTIMLLLAGLVLLGVGAFQLMKAAKGSFLDKLEPQVARQPWAKWAGQAGYAARGVIFLITGFFLLRAGMEEQASEAGGMEAALGWLSNPWDLVVAVGLFGFGIFSLIEARYRRLHQVPVQQVAARAARKSPV